MLKPRKIIFVPLPQKSIPSKNNVTRDSLWIQIKHNLILLSKKKMNRKIGSYGRYYCLRSLDSSLYLLLPLVFTATVLEISLFQASERQYSSFEKVQVSKKFSGVGSTNLRPPIKLNDSLGSLVRLRSLYIQRCVKRCVCVWWGGGVGNFSMFWQNVSVKCPDSMLFVNLQYFNKKNKTKTKCRILSIFSPAEIKLLPAMT